VSGTVEIRMENDHLRYSSIVSAETFDSRAFMDAMTWPGREWEFGLPVCLPMIVGERVMITLPEFEFSVRARIMRQATEADATVLRLREDDPDRESVTESVTRFDSEGATNAAE
jgi:hypothetical protein